MLTISNLSTPPTFYWTGCTAPGYGDFLRRIDQFKRVEEVEEIKGHDAKSPPWTFNPRKRDDKITYDKLQSARKVDGVCDLTFTDENGLSALNIIQEAWARATRENCSLIVIQSGNYELIGIRHRETQTLYISDIIRPYDYPLYGKLHVGIFIAAVEDSIDGAKQDIAQADSGDEGGGLKLSCRLGVLL